MGETTTGTLIIYEQACRDIERMATPEAVIEFAAKSDAVRIYAKLAKNTALEVDAAEIRIRAEYRLGTLLIEGIKSGKFNKPGQCHKRRLIDMGVDKKLSMRSQSLARLGHSFNDQLDKWRARVSRGDQRVIPYLRVRIPKDSHENARRPLDYPLNCKVAGRGRWANICIGELRAIIDEANQNRNLAMAVLEALPQGLSTTRTLMDLIDDEVLDVNVIKRASEMRGIARS